jgi:hypothetical protein
MSKKVYTLGGHGTNGNDTFIVPKGCTVVVQVGKGDYAYSYDDNVNDLCVLDNKIIENPSKYSDVLIHKYGSIAIYQAGDECPNFQYFLLGCTRNETDIYDLCSNPSSGVVDIKQAKLAGECMTDIIAIDTSNIAEYIQELYKHSVWPKRDDINKILSVISHLEPNDILSKLENLLQISQKELCSRFPGVYYNFVCRVSSNSSNVIKGKIQEAEMHRKSHLRKYYLSNKYKNNIKANYKTRMNRITSKIDRLEQNIKNKSGYPNLAENMLENEEDLNIALKAKQNLIKNYSHKKGFVNNNNIHKYKAYNVNNDNYIKINGKWVPRTKRTQKMKHARAQKDLTLF